jgi:mevalonate kinase
MIQPSQEEYRFFSFIFSSLILFLFPLPFQVGLSGSSAIIVATYKGLMEFFGLTLHDLKLELAGAVTTFFYVS